MKERIQTILHSIRYILWWLVHEWLFDLGYFVSRVVAWIVSRPKIYGRENIPRKGGVIITMNHLSQWDLVFIHALLERSAYYMAKKEFLDFFLVGGLVRLLGAFPVNRGKYDREALQYSIRLLKEGKQLIIFPEGTRSKTYALGEGHNGAALIAQHSGALIVPVAIYGSEKISRKKESGPGGKRRRRPEVVVRVGQPYRLPETPKGQRENLPEQADFMMSKIAALLPPEYQGQYSPEKLAGRKARREQQHAEQQALRAARRQARQQAKQAEEAVKNDSSQ